MTTEELQQISALLDAKLAPIQKDIADMKDDMSDIKEQLSDINGAINEIGDWVEKASAIVHIPYADTPAGKEMLRQLLEEQAQNK